MLKLYIKYKQLITDKKMMKTFPYLTSFKIFLNTIRCFKNDKKYKKLLLVFKESITKFGTKSLFSLLIILSQEAPTFI